MCVPNSRLVSSGNPDTEVWETTKAQFVIQENTTKTTTENLAAPFEDISKENPRKSMKTLGSTSSRFFEKEYAEKEKIGTKYTPSKKSVLF